MMNALAITGSYACALLSPMLQSMQPKEGYSSYILTWSINANHAALFMQVLVHAYTHP